MVAYKDNGVGEVNMSRLCRLKDGYLKASTYKEEQESSFPPSLSHSPTPGRRPSHSESLANKQAQEDDQTNIFSKKFGVDVYSMENGQLLHRMVVKGEYKFINVSQ